METRSVIHPSAEALRAFALGKMDDSTASVFMSHLDICPECCQAVAALSGDDFLGRMRQAHGRSETPAPARSLPTAARAPKPAAGETPVPNLPSELTNNPQYEVLRELGRGGMGVVYQARHRLSGRLEVLKVMNKELLSHPESKARFLKEIQSAARLSHAHVVKMYTALEMGELMVLVMEYVEGDDLAKLVKSQGPLSVLHACYYVQQVALGLQHAFENGMVHRDIKPQNLMLVREGKRHVVKVLDFGLAKARREKNEDTGLTGEGAMMGTPDYIAPEQILDAANVDIRADVYSLGCTLYYLLTGAPPFKGRSLYEILQAHHSMDAKPLNLARPEVPEELAAVVRKMMAKAPAQRYQTPGEVARALAAFIKPGAKGALPKPLQGLSVGEQEATAERSTATAAESVTRKRASTQVPVAASSETMTEGSSTSAAARKSGSVRKLRQPAVKPAPMWKYLIRSGIGLGVLLILVGLWAGGVFKVTTSGGTIVLENLPADAEVLVDGAVVEVTWGKPSKKAQISVKPGTRKIVARKDGVKVIGEEVEIADGGLIVLTARMASKDKDQAKADPRGPDGAEKTPTPDAGKPKEEGFVMLFNGKDLTGWSVDGGPPGQWSVEADTIVAQSKGFGTRNYLLTEKDYTDFILRFNFKVEDKSHGGVAIRAIEGEKLPLGKNFIFDHPIIKLTNPLLEEKEPTGTSHWLNSTQAYARALEVLPLPTGVWHSMTVIVRGNTCTATIGGQKIVDLTLDSDLRKDMDIVPGLGRHKGKVGFQINTGILRFRKIEIKELPPATTGFVPLFNGKDLTGWKTHPKQPGNWRVEDGILTGSSDGVSHLYTDSADYTNFHLRLQARLNLGEGFRSTGVYFRAPFGPNLPANVKMPVSPSNQLTWISAYNAKIDARRLGGLLIDLNPELHRTREKVLRPGEWINYEIIAEGNHFVIKVNGETTSDYTDELRL